MNSSEISSWPALTKEEAEKLLADKLSEYIIAPEVSIKIIGYNSKVVYVVGEVGAPGKIFMRGDTITVREALMQAGLPQLTGVTRKSRLITPSESGDAGHPQGRRLRLTLRRRFA